MADRHQPPRRFKVCSLCGRVWAGRDCFLGDPAVRVIGYQADFATLERGLFLFNHVSCGTTLAIRVGAFADLRRGPVFEERLTGTDACPEYCLHDGELAPCPARCECAFVRDVLQRIRNGTWRPPAGHTGQLSRY